MNEDLLKDTIKELSCFSFCSQCALMTVFAKDLGEYITTNVIEGEAVQFFQETYTGAISPDRFYWYKCEDGHLFNSIRTVDLKIKSKFEISSNRFAETFNGIKKYEIEPEDEEEDDANAKIFQIDQSELNHEWLRYPGWAMVRTFRKILEKEKNDLSLYDFDGSKNEQALKLAKALLDHHLTEDQYWYPFVATMSILLTEEQNA